MAIPRKFTGVRESFSISKLTLDDAILAFEAPENGMSPEEAFKHAIHKKDFLPSAIDDVNTNFRVSEEHIHIIANVFYKEFNISNPQVKELVAKKLGTDVNLNQVLKKITEEANAFTLGQILVEAKDPEAKLRAITRDVEKDGASLKNYLGENSFVGDGVFFELLSPTKVFDTDPEGSQISLKVFNFLKDFSYYFIEGRRAFGEKSEIDFLKGLESTLSEFVANGYNKLLIDGRYAVDDKKSLLEAYVKYLSDSKSILTAVPVGVNKYSNGSIVPKKTYIAINNPSQLLILLRRCITNLNNRAGKAVGKGKVVVVQDPAERARLRKEDKEKNPHLYKVKHVNVGNELPEVKTNVGMGAEAETLIGTVLANKNSRYLTAYKALNKLSDNRIDNVFELIYKKLSRGQKIEPHHQQTMYDFAARMAGALFIYGYEHKKAALGLNNPSLEDVKFAARDLPSDVASTLIGNYKLFFGDPEQLQELKEEVQRQVTAGELTDINDRSTVEGILLGVYNDVMSEPNQDLMMPDFVEMAYQQLPTHNDTPRPTVVITR